MNDEKKVLDFVVGLCVRHGAERVVLFGSRARGDGHELSDFDIAIFGIKDTKRKLDIRETCDESAPTLKTIDIVFAQDAGEKLLQNIKKDGIILYERNKD